MTLSCQTKLALQRSAARLLFSFYKGGRAVRGRGLSPELQVPAASEAHSGSYWCEAATEDNHVWKRSPRLEIRVQGEWACWLACGRWGQDAGPCGAQCEQVHRDAAEAAARPGPLGTVSVQIGTSPQAGGRLPKQDHASSAAAAHGDAPTRDRSPVLVPGAP